MLIKIKNLRKIYNKGTDAQVEALKNVSLSIEEGELLGIVGTSGSGKSTLLHILSCNDHDYDGEIIFDGNKISDLSSSHLAEFRNQKIGIVLQNFGLIYDMTVFENVALPIYLSNTRITKNDVRDKIYKLLEKLNIKHKSDVKVSMLSGGQKQRVAIARALINNPKLILADEPTGSLDEKTSSEIMKVLTELNNEGCTVIIVTHNQLIAQQCNRVIRISEGMIVDA